MATYGKHDRQITPKKRKILLVACGSFNPITNMHLRMFEVARDALEQIHPFCHIIGIISPVNDKYSRKEIAPSYDRIEMVKLALTSSDWIKVDSWEASQDTWLETLKILKHVREVATSYFPAGDDNDNENAHSTKRRRTRDVNKNIERAEDSSAVTFTDIEVKLLCGADVIQSFAVPDLWKPDHIEEIVRDFGMVVCNRVGYDLDKFIYEFDTLSSNKRNIMVITDWITNEISSTKIRRALKRGESVKYLLQDLVIDYIHHKQLYNAKITNEILGISRKLAMAAGGISISKKKEMFLKKPPKDKMKNESNVCSYCHLYTCCCCWFLDDNPTLDVGNSLFQHHHHYHLPPHPHPALHSNVHHCHPMSMQADLSHWTHDLAENLPTDDETFKSEGTETFFSQSLDVPGISLPVRSETNV